MSKYFRQSLYHLVTRIRFPAVTIYRDALHIEQYRRFMESTTIAIESDHDTRSDQAVPR